MRRGALRHGDAAAARRLRADLGSFGGAILAQSDPRACDCGLRTSASWPRSTGTANGHCCSKGFDYAYDKRLYDRLRMGHARPVREHLQAGLDYQNKLARFLENHDEPRAAATFLHGTHEAAAVITFLSPGLRFFHQGQFEGRTKRISPHLVRAPNEPIDEFLQLFYKDLLAVLRSPAVATANGVFLSVRRPGTATGRGTAASLGAGKQAVAASGSWSP